MNPLTTKLAYFLRQHEVQDGILLAGVSGGADSIALLQALHDARDEFRLSLRVVHVDHGLRARSQDDAEWVQALCGRLSIPCTVERVDVRGAGRGAGIEETARRIRYQVFDRSARASGANWVATAHTSDDQVETVLHHILRGTGLKGLCGIPQRRELNDGIQLIRPLLDVTRQQVEAYLHERRQDYRTDPTNLEAEYTRNRLRQIVLPLLRTESGERVDQSLLRLSRQAAEAQQVIESLARGLLERCALELTPHTVRLSCAELATAPRLVVREAFNLLWRRQNWPRQSMTAASWDSLAELACGPQQTRSSYPGAIEASRRGPLLMLRRLVRC